MGVQGFRAESAPAGNQAYLKNFSAGVVGSGTAASTANTIALTRLPRVIVSYRVTRMGVINGTVVAANMDLALMTSSDEVNFTRVASSGPIAAAGSSVIQWLTLTAAYVLVPGVDYWAAWGEDALNPVVRFVPSVGLGVVKAEHVSKATAWASGIPATLTGMAGSAFSPLIFLDGS